MQSAGLTGLMSKLQYSSLQVGANRQPWVAVWHRQLFGMSSPPLLLNGLRLPELEHRYLLSREQEQLVVEIDTIYRHNPSQALSSITDDRYSERHVVTASWSGFLDACRLQSLSFVLSTKLAARMNKLPGCSLSYFTTSQGDPNATKNRTATFAQ